MHERWGEAGVARCLGAFAFALWDAEARRLTLGRDCLGNRALFYHRGPQFVAFATTLGALLALPGVPRAIDEMALAQFMAVNHREQQRTFYRGIERVPSRTMVSVDRNGMPSRKYWTPDLDAPPLYRREEDYIERARELLDIAVASATRDTPKSPSRPAAASILRRSPPRPRGSAGREHHLLFRRCRRPARRSTSVRSTTSTNATRSKRWRACIRAGRALHYAGARRSIRLKTTPAFLRARACRHSAR